MNKENLPQGLKNHEVEKLIKKYGYNEPQTQNTNTAVKTFLSQFNNPLIILLLVVIAISFFLNEYLDIYLLIIVIIINVAIGFIQEYSSQKTLEKLKGLVKTENLVIRNGKREKIESRNIVPGDIIVLTKGDKIPADSRVVQANNFIVNEAFLTGESEPVKKEENTEVFVGSFVIGGSATIQATKTGKATRYGALTQRLSNLNTEKTYTQKQIAQFSNKIMIIAAIIAILVVVISIVRGENLLNSIRTAITLSVTIIPESLILIISLALTIGAQRIFKQKGLVKKLDSVENLGLTTTLCIDKTGTLTEGKMKVVTEKIQDKTNFLLGIDLMNEQKSGIELALLNYLNKNRIHAKYNPNNYLRITYKEFDSERKYTYGIFTNKEKHRLIVMGTPYVVIDFCYLSDEKKAELKKEIDAVASQGQKLIAVAFKEDANEPLLQDLHWTGFVGIEDNLRRNAQKSINEIIDSGIDIKILTGDNPITAKMIASKLGDFIDSDDITASAKEIQHLSGNDVKRYKIFANITPAQKLEIVSKLKENNEVITMIGDGINDVLALKKADVAVSMGQASDIAKEEGDLVLLNNDLSIILKTIEQGRLAFKNIKNIISYVLSNSFAEITIILLAFVFGLPFPFTIPQILWIHVICDGPLDFALAFENNTQGLMNKNFNKKNNRNIINNDTYLLVSMISLFIGIISFAIFFITLKQTGDIKVARTLVFITSAISSIVYVYSFKNMDLNIWNIKELFKNRFLNISIIISIILAILPLIISRLGTIFETSKLSTWNILIISLFSIALATWVEFAKLVKIKIHSQKQRTK
ncbi:cation-transporting P-type ATPase [Candidatus Dojkabacteria bacterium]|nr:cation-transporting P-type ATPase [Candidatus Dojkabacteria bacterium]